MIPWALSSCSQPALLKLSGVDAQDFDVHPHGQGGVLDGFRTLM
jgi:hypothetical protein